MSEPGTTTFFHRHDGDGDPQELLVPENQFSSPWGGPDHGPCDKCGGRGRCRFRCRSCLEEGARGSCPACGGRVEFEDRCPTCEGSGEITRTKRRGISVFPSRAGLYRYLVENGGDLEDAEIVELDGDLSDDLDLDADYGALLVHPTRIVGRFPIDEERIEELRGRLA